ncbi:PKD domain containing protein [Fluviicola taffensis DSM 16823]|uniref:PKD domain containing protein n=2 Tax=Fluviicola TaxID=332102 RepID=F2I9B9_FLUTR|nr:PKD domain containing protein [Fluviicola taffensis DSM 16823]
MQPFLVTIVLCIVTYFTFIHMKLTTTLIALLSVISTANAQFPGCPSVDAGSDQTLTCNQPCATLNAVPFHAGATSTYVVGSIPHTPPIAYNQAGGTAVSVNTDDVWSPQIALPFNFCYYGQTYTTCKIGSNGSIKFGTYAPTSQPYEYPGNCPNLTLRAYGDVYGVLHDIDPSEDGTVNWYVLGAAPCRIFVVSFNNLAHFDCTNLHSTHMMVLYETTNVIDVYVNNKATCNSWEDGYAIVGIQNPAGTAGVAAPGRNATPAWTVTTPEAWRFTPNGAPIYTTQWFQGATSIGTGTSVNVCPTVATTYTAQVTYTACDGTVIVKTDDMIVTPDPATPSGNEIASTPSSCTGATGSVEVLGTGGAGGYQYSIDNGANWQSSGVFTNLAGGNYTILVQDANGCQGSISANVPLPTIIDLTIASTTNVSCNGDSNGSAVTAVSGGQAPLNYTLNGGSSQTSGTYSNLAAGSYTIQVTDVNGCTDSQPVTITEPAVVTLSFVSSTDASCSGNDGSLTVSGAGGTGVLHYSLNGGTSQTNATFANLAGGTYTVQVVDDNGCSASTSAIVDVINNLTALLIDDQDVSCNGLSDGTVQLGGTGTPAPYTYSLVGGTSQTSNTFTGLGAGTYNYVVTDGNNCRDTVSVTITEPTVISITTNTPLSTCIEGSVTMNAQAAGGAGGYVYTWSNSLPNGQANTVTPVATTTYIVTATDVNNCNSTAQIQVTVNPKPSINAGNDQTICLGSQIILSGAGGVSYSWSNSVPNNTSFTPNLGVSSLVVTGTDANGCTNTDTLIITVLPIPTAVLGANSPLSGHPGLVVQFTNASTNSNSYHYEYGNGSTFQTSNISLTPSSTYNTPGTYTVVLTASNGVCQDTAELQVIVFPYAPLSVVVPNIFTPNGDSNNDVFFVKLENATSIELIIVNRWGNFMAKISDINGSWDGKVNGNMSSEGVYFYKYTVNGLDGTTQTGHGDIQLIRD